MGLLVGDGRKQQDSKDATEYVTVFVPQVSTWISLEARHFSSF